MFAAAVWIKNVECPMNVTAARAAPRAAGWRTGCSIRAGQGVRGSRIIRGTALNGCGSGPDGLKNRVPSK